MEAAGFRSYLQKGIELRAGEAPRIDVALEIGSMTESVTVSGAAPLLATETATMIGGMTNPTIMRIPILQMRAYNVMMYLPGFANPSEGSFFSMGQRTRIFVCDPGWGQLEAASPRRPRRRRDRLAGGNRFSGRDPGIDHRRSR